jgi:hypothetical protein
LIDGGIDTFYVPALGNQSYVKSSLERFLAETAEPLRASGHFDPAKSTVLGPGG